jgi:murein DD-endopeptidase MepM/ murein hydrolase activator NlpD
LTFECTVGNLADVRRRVCLALICLCFLASAPFPKWKARSRSGVAPNRRAAQLIAPELWRDEPKTPAQIDLPRFGAALNHLCGPMPAERRERYARHIVESATRHGEDPFMLAAIIHRLTRCDPRAQTSEGVGLSAIQPDMYAENVRGKTLRYLVEGGDGWAEREKTLSHPLTEAVLRNPEDNIEWAAALLAMWREQHAEVDAKFEQVPHRHYVSHFVWGDHVESGRVEDRIFTDRRRLLLHYGVPLPTHTVPFRGVSWGCPLEAAPRVVSSSPGASRADGLRRHRGVDVEAVYGEPVLAMADGTVFFAGIDLPGMGAQGLSPAAMNSIPRRQMGAGGRFVCVDHAGAQPDELYLRSCYMHLEQVYVRTGEVLKRGTPIGTVGRTGMKTSAPHLHLEIKSDKHLYDARDVVPTILLGEPPPEPRPLRRARAINIYRPSLPDSASAPATPPP